MHTSPAKEETSLAVSPREAYAEQTNVLFHLSSTETRQAPPQPAPRCAVSLRGGSGEDWRGRNTVAAPSHGAAAPGRCLHAALCTPGEPGDERAAAGRGLLAKQTNQLTKKEKRCKSQAPLLLFPI